MSPASGGGSMGRRRGGCAPRGIARPECGSAAPTPRERSLPKGALPNGGIFEAVAATLKPDAYNSKENNKRNFLEITTKS